MESFDLIHFLLVADYLSSPFLGFNFVKTLTKTPQEPKKAAEVSAFAGAEGSDPETVPECLRAVPNVPAPP